MLSAISALRPRRYSPRIVERRVLALYTTPSVAVAGVAASLSATITASCRHDTSPALPRRISALYLRAAEVQLYRWRYAFIIATLMIRVASISLVMTALAFTLLRFAMRLPRLLIFRLPMCGAGTPH